MSDGYHHGDLRRALLDEAASLITDEGPQAASLRELARRVGVSHAAPTHHFGDRRGLLTALAAEGLGLLTEALRSATPEGFDQAAVAYVQFARSHPGHYTVMHRPELLDSSDPALHAARATAAQALAGGVATIPQNKRAHLSLDQGAQTAWALVHGLASLTAEGAIPPDTIDTLTRQAAHQLFG
ncbi:TetR/AcrR family transcriptional regulator [Nocardioides houyundeii]|uniref:TetR/AcrR family transcriptional regulator n=1 Tax=Nocardioides houyundeii TaxID=2045452 RepID=UPI000C761112|nr:TetR/AcrR family transcriptional regulator [Nocardioides houyundeii]